jgi:hypothetical protein
MGMLLDLALKARIGREGQGVGPSLAEREADTELRRLVNEVADVHGFSPEDRAEAMEIALRDPDRNRALKCYRALAAECSGMMH